MNEKTLLVYRRVDRERSPVSYVLSLVASGYLRATRDLKPYVRWGGPKDTTDRILVRCRSERGSYGYCHIYMTRLIRD